MIPVGQIERMFAVNSVNLFGRLVRDVELKYTQSGTAVAKFTTAVDRDNKKKLKEQGQPTADFISCIAWGKTAELIGKYFSKGSQIGVTGRLQTGSYTKQDGSKVYTTDVVADKVTFVDKGNNDSFDNGVAGNIGESSEEVIPF